MGTLKRAGSLSYNGREGLETKKREKKEGNNSITCFLFM